MVLIGGQITSFFEDALPLMNSRSGTMMIGISGRPTAKFWQDFRPQQPNTAYCGGSLLPVCQVFETFEDSLQAPKVLRLIGNPFDGCQRKVDSHG